MLLLSFCFFNQIYKLFPLKRVKHICFFLFSDFIVKVKVESEFVDDYFSFIKGLSNYYYNNNITVIVQLE